MKKVLVLTLSVILMLTLAACSSTDSAATESPSADAAASADSGEAVSDAQPMHIALITMDQMDVHWVKLEAAARAEVEKLNSEGYDIEYEWLAPEKKDNAQQIQQIETAINNGADCIIIAVNDTTACNDALQQAIDAGIKLVYVDATASLDADATFATNNYEAGVLAGETMLHYLEEAGIESGMIGIVSAQAGVQSGQDRCDGFASVFEGTNYTTSEVQYSDGDASKAQELATALINDGCVAMYGANDGSTTGTANAVMEANSNGKNIICVGFDNSSANRDLVRDGAMLAFMAQNPNVMGEESIKAAVDLLSGKSLENTEVDTGVSVVDIDNVDDFND